MTGNTNFQKLGLENKGLTATMYSKKAILGQPVKTCHRLLNII